MVARQTDADKTTTRVYKYGLVPKGYLPEEGINELWRANNLWNSLVAIHKKGQKDFQDARYSANKDYAEVSDKLDDLNSKVDAAYESKRNARMKAATRDTSHPLIKAANDVIQDLKKQRREVYDEIKPLRKEADKLFDTKILNSDFTKAVNAAVRVENSNLFSKTAEAVKDYFLTARKRTFASNAELQFKRFDGTGFFNYRFRRKDAKVDGISLRELFVGNNPDDGRRFVFTGEDNTRKKTRLKLRAILAGGAKKESKVYQEFDLIYHRPIPDNAQIQNGKIVRSRTGDKFRFDLVLTLKLPKTILQKVPNNVAIGIDIGFRRTGTSLQIAAVRSNKFSEPLTEVIVPVKMVKSLEHLESLTGELADSAADLGKKIKKDLQANPLEEDHKKYKVWRSAAKAPANVTMSHELAYKLAGWFRHEPDAMPEIITKPVLYWWKGYSRRYREIHNLRKKQLLNRKHYYRQVASDIVKQGRLIVLEEINLTVFAEAKDRDNKLGTTARSNRFMGSPSEFRDAIINAADREGIPCVKVGAAYTSKTCSDCGFKNDKLGAEKSWTCDKCGETHDRDENAAKNIAKKGSEYFEKLQK